MSVKSVHKCAMVEGYVGHLARGVQRGFTLWAFIPVTICGGRMTFRCVVA